MSTLYFDLIKKLVWISPFKKQKSMAITSSIRKCPKCGAFNTDKEVCEQCGQILSYKKKQELREQRMREEQLASLQDEIENPNFVERMKSHRFFIVRVFGYVLYSVWFVVTIIGLGLAWAISMLAAG